MIQTVDDDDPAKPALFHAYGRTFLDQFHQSGVPRALDESI